MRIAAIGIVGGAMALAGAAQALETPMQYVPPPAPEPVPQAQPAPAAPGMDLSPMDRLRAVIGRPADCPPEEAAKPRETGV